MVCRSIASAATVGRVGMVNARSPGTAGVASSDPAALLFQDFLDRQPLLAAINVVIATLTEVVLARGVPSGASLAWLAAMLAAQCARIAIWRGARRGSVGGTALPQLLTLATALTGLLWGVAGVVTVRYGPPAAGLLVPFVLAGMSAGSITALPSHPPAFFVFIWATLLPYALHLAGSGDTVARSMAGITLLYAAGLSAVGWQIHRTLRQAAEVSLQNTVLVDRLDAARHGLEATVASRTTELRASNAALLREVADRRRSEDRVRYLLAHDPLTNLPNRLLLLDRLSQALARSRRYGTKTAVLLFDLDRFKDVNDSFGHPAGDRLLCELAHRVLAAVRASDTLARFGGDEFALVAPDLTEGAEFAAAGTAGRRRLPHPVRFGRRAGVGHRERRCRPVPGAWRGRGHAAAGGRCRALSRQRRWQGPDGPLFAGAALRPGVPAPARGRAAPRHRSRRVPSRIPAALRHRQPPGDRGRGAAALAAPAVRRGCRPTSSSRWRRRAA